MTIIARCVRGDVLRAEEVGVDKTEDRAIEDADILDSDSDVPLLGLGHGETEPAEKVAPLGTEPAEVAVLSREPVNFPNGCPKRENEKPLPETTNRCFSCSGSGQGL